MAFKKTMAIIGATSVVGKAIAYSMSNGYRLLLMDYSAADLFSLASQIHQRSDTSVIETVSCCKEASWEAEVIVVVVEAGQLAAVAKKIEEVTTRKLVIHFTNEDENDVLSQLLPHAKVVAVSIKSLHSTSFVDAQLHGTDPEALEIAHEILQLLPHSSFATSLLN